MKRLEAGRNCQFISCLAVALLGTIVLMRPGHAAAANLGHTGTAAPGPAQATAPTWDREEVVIGLSSRGLETFDGRLLEVSPGVVIYGTFKGNFRPSPSNPYRVKIDLEVKPSRYTYRLPEQRVVAIKVLKQLGGWEQ